MEIVGSGMVLHQGLSAQRICRTPPPTPLLCWVPFQPSSCFWWLFRKKQSWFPPTKHLHGYFLNHSFGSSASRFMQHPKNFGLIASFLDRKVSGFLWILSHDCLLSKQAFFHLILSCEGISRTFCEEAVGASWLPSQIPFIQTNSACQLKGAFVPNVQYKTRNLAWDSYFQGKWFTPSAKS